MRRASCQRRRAALKLIRRIRPRVSIVREVLELHASHIATLLGQGALHDGRIFSIRIISRPHSYALETECFVE